MTMRRFTWHRLWAVVLKEFVQMRRDRVTFGMMVGIPLLQLMLFGFAINSDPRHLPTALRLADQGPFARALVAALYDPVWSSSVRSPVDVALVVLAVAALAARSAPPWLVVVALASAPVTSWPRLTSPTTRFCVVGAVTGATASSRRNR